VTRPDLGDIAAPVWMPTLLWLALAAFAVVDGFSGADCATPLADLVSSESCLGCCRER
jgi:hypothetical protein